MGGNGPTANEMQQEHQHLASLIERAQQAVEKIASPVMCQAQLQNLRDELRRHFQLEEQGGYMQEIREKRPNWNDRIDDLLTQHAAMLSTMGELLDEADEIVRRTEQWQANFEKLLSALDNHEHAENQLVQEAYEQDIGSKD